MKTDITALIESALQSVLTCGAATFDLPAHISLTRTRGSIHGDLATNVALTLAKSAAMPSRTLAQLIVDHLPQSRLLARAEVAGSGFINIHLATRVSQSVVAEILHAKENYGRSNIGRDKNISIKFFCTAPTGPLLVDHGRQAAYSASVAALLEAVGYTVHRQMDMLPESVFNAIENDLSELGVCMDELAEDAPDALKAHPVQPVVLYRNGVKVNRSALSGEPVTLRELLDEVGHDAARFFYVMRSQDQPLDFALDLAKSSREDNPVFYVQYAHVRALRIFRHPEYNNAPWDRENGKQNLGLLVQEPEQALLDKLSRYPKVIQIAAKNRTPHTVVIFLLELTASFHKFYNACRVLCDDTDLRDARLSLVKASAQVIQNGLALLGLSAPTKM